LGWKRSNFEIPILHNFESHENQRGISLQYIKNAGWKKYWRGATRRSRACQARPTPVGAPGGSWAPCYPSGSHLLLYGAFRPRKYRERAFGKKRHHHEAELEQNQSRASAGPSCRGNFPPGGGNRRHHHQQHSSHRRGLISINIFISTISSPNHSSFLVHSLRLTTPIGTCKVASSVNYSL
ncbi:uncharacterized protein LOC123447399, partial [Hordeum vulgare subsp. vulgare]|uniref:uncharacterized protein LOC123447399 n=1 Tax=Hordeum vulgare subsp. vulgare TaxID=112509 RepID=UPI001D1A4D96